MNFLNITKNKLLDSLYRHVNAFAAGEDCDPETGLSHIAHAQCNLMFIMNNIINDVGIDDRYRSTIKNPTQ